MAYTGNTPTSQGFTPAVDYFNGDGVTVSFTLSRVVLSVYQVEVVVDNVVQNPSSAYNILNSVITFTGAPLVGTNNVWVRYVALNSALTIVQPGAVGTPQLGNINTIVSATSLVLKTNSGVAALTIDANQNVTLVGTTTTTNLAYTGTLTGSTGILNIGSGQVYKDASGNVGIGTSSPFNATGWKALSIDGTSQSLLDLRINGASSAFVYASAASFNIVNTSATTPLVFQTNSIERMRISASGNVGIGTSSPSAILSVSQNTNAQSWLALRNTNAGSSASSGLLFGNDANAAYGALYVNSSTNTGFGGPNSINLGSYGAYPLTFLTSSTERMRIDSSGNVGIGTSSPILGLTIKNDTGSTTYGQRGGSLVLESYNFTAGGGTDVVWSSGTQTNQRYASIGSGIVGNDGASGSRGDLIFATKATSAATTLAERMRIDSSGNLLVGTTSPYSSSHTFSKNPGAGQFTTSILNSKTDNSTATLGLLVKYTGVTPSDGNHIFRCEDSGGTQRFYVQNNGTYGGTSDARLKNNITDSTPKLSDLLNIKVRNFYWNDNENDKNLGFIAQEVEEIFPALIVEDDNGYKTIKHSVFTPMLVKAIQELKAIIDTQNARIEALEAK